MRALAWIGLVFTLLLGADGIYMVATNYQPDDHGRFNLSDGGTVLVAAAILFIVTLIAFIAAKKNKSISPVTSNQVKEG